MAAVAPMDLVMRSEAVAIPLRCTICPKKPNFSDLSHLLTHISSKSHLSHRFKVELKARADRDALEEVRQYDDWCERYGINALLAERMTAKEQKKTGRRGRSSNTTKPNPDGAANRRTAIKPDPEDYYTESITATGQYGAAGPVLLSNGRQGYFDTSDYQTPNLQRTRSDRSAPNTPDDGMGSEYQRWPSETATTDSAPVSELTSESNDLLGDDNDSSKLKGVRYPGMGLFDSADETQKRMRNQRKDDSVLKQMEQTSSGIEPTEFVWTEDGEFQRIRDIYASPSIEGSPDRKFEERDTHRRKRGRYSTTSAAQPSRQRPSSTRYTRRMASRVRSAPEDDDPLDDDQGGRNSSHSHGSTDTYDIFRDPPKPSPARTLSPLEESGLDLRRRPALQTLNANIPLSSPAMKPKPLPYFSGRDNGPVAFTSQPSLSNTHYFQQQHALGGGTFNPLAQTRSGYYHPYGYQAYGNEAKPTATNFHAINAMNLGGMPFNAFPGPFGQDSTHDRVDQEFDL